MNEALHRELRYWAERVTSQHEERLRLVGEVFCMHKMATFVSAAYSPGTRQKDQQYLSHVVAGEVCASLIGPRSVGDVAPQITPRTGTEHVLSHLFSHIVTPAAKRSMLQDRAVRNEPREESAPSVPAPKARVRKPMKKRTAPTATRRVRRARK